MRNKFILLSLTMLLQGCSSPFGQGSWIDAISSQINLFFGKTESNLLAGATRQFQTAASYKGSSSVGN